MNISSVARPQQHKQPLKKADNPKSVHFGTNGQQKPSSPESSTAAQSSEVKDESQKTIFEKVTDKLKAIGQSISDKVGERFHNFIEGIKDKVVGVAEKAMEWVMGKVEGLLERAKSFFGAGQQKPQAQPDASANSSTAHGAQPSAGTPANSAV